MEPKTVAVQIGELRFSDDPHTVLVTYALGSCIGVTAYDPVTRLAGMALVLLPRAPKGAAAAPGEAKYANAGVPALVEGMVRRGAAKHRLVIKIAGGARILALTLGSPNGPDIGQQNQEAVARALEEQGLAVAGNDCGGSLGRTMRLFVESGAVEVQTAAKGVWHI